MESSSAWVTGEEHTGGPSRPVRFLEGWLSCSWVLNGPLLISCMSILWGFQISSQRKLKTISVIKAIFIIFHVFEKHGVLDH